MAKLQQLLNRIRQAKALQKLETELINQQQSKRNKILSKQIAKELDFEIQQFLLS